MHRRQFLKSTALVGATAAVPQAVWAATAEDAKLSVLFDAFFNEGVDESPQQASSLGLDKGARAGLKSRLNDYSAAGKAQRLVRVKDRLARLHGIGRAALSPKAALDYDIVDYDLSRSVASETRFSFGSARGNFQPYVITQQQGPYRDIPDFLDSTHKIVTADDAEAYLARLSAFPKALDDSLDRQMADAARGIFAPDFALDITLQQLAALRNQPADRTVLAESIVRRAKAAGLTADYGPRAVAIVDTQVFPALDRHVAAITALRAKASSEAGVWRLPDGDAYYAAGVKSSTTTELTPDEVHRLGLAQVAEISGRLDVMLKAQGLTKGTVGERLTALNNRADQVFPNTDAGRTALIAQLNAQIKDAYPRLPQLFNTLPKAIVEVRRVPAFIQDGAANGYYQSAATDGSRPAAFYINLKDTAEWPKYGLASLTYHEAVPGHHMQVSIAQESTDIPMLRRRGGYSAYSEGWALYAEQVADELGVYDQDPLGRIGYLQSFLFRAARLVCDTGIHYKRWGRDKATDYLVGATGFPRGRSQREVERYCVGPAQALSYKVGHTQWAKLRDAVRAKQGAAFDPRQFHEVLRQGAMPLVILERVVMARA
ncbi:MAG: DUF885 domain-containing protein [Alphaproteobacteria bacterium]|nr:MAG: DUF885 domain-containing protein [Alphaproteobacteria bacterium]